MDKQAKKGIEMRVSEGKFMILPPAPDKCQECANDHKPEEPHNITSIFYLVKFKNDHGRDATFADASAHCSDLMKEYFALKLRFLQMSISGEPFPDDVAEELCRLEREVYPDGR
jgi:hypothetical protein